MVIEVPERRTGGRARSQKSDGQKGHQDVNLAITDSFAAMERQLKDYVDRRREKRRSDMKSTPPDISRRFMG